MVPQIFVTRQGGRTKKPSGKLTVCELENHQKSLKSGNQLYWLVVSTPLKNMKVKWDDYSQYMGK